MPKWMKRTRNCKVCIASEHRYPKLTLDGLFQIKNSIYQAKFRKYTVWNLPISIVHLGRTTWVISVHSKRDDLISYRTLSVNLFSKNSSQVFNEFTSKIVILNIWLCIHVEKIKCNNEQIIWKIVRQIPNSSFTCSIIAENCFIVCKFLSVNPFTYKICDELISKLGNFFVILLYSICRPQKLHSTYVVGDSSIAQHFAHLWD